jgi:hypothetical protein
MAAGGSVVVGAARVVVGTAAVSLVVGAVVVVDVASVVGVDVVELSTTVSRTASALSPPSRVRATAVAAAAPSTNTPTTAHTHRGRSWQPIIGPPAPARRDRRSSWHHDGSRWASLPEP